MIDYSYDIEMVKGRIEKGIRTNNRKDDEYREIKIETGILKNAAGSAKVTLGKTMIYAGTKLEIGTPYPDTPEEGGITVGVELSPIGAPEFYAGPPSETSIELSRVVDRGIREAKTIDFKKLLLVPKEKAWFVYVDIYVMNHDGNLFDACQMAAMAALKTTKIPKIDKEFNQIKGEYSGNLKLEKLPVLNTYSKISNKIILDPDLNEDYATEARLSIAIDDNLNICALQKGEKGFFTQDELKEMIKTSKKKYKEMRKIFEKL